MAKKNKNKKAKPLASSADKSLLTPSAFARLVGVNRNAVANAIKRGRVTVSIVDGKKLIDPKKSVKEWEENANPAARAKGQKTPNKNGVKPVVSARTPDALAQDKDVTIFEAERREKLYKSKLAELKYQEQVKQLISVDKVEKQAFEMGRKVRDGIARLPARISHELAAETDPHALEIKLSKELTKVLEKIIVNKIELT